MRNIEPQQSSARILGTWTAAKELTRGDHVKIGKRGKSFASLSGGGMQAACRAIYGTKEWGPHTEQGRQDGLHAGHRHPVPWVMDDSTQLWEVGGRVVTSKWKTGGDANVSWNTIGGRA